MSRTELTASLNFVDTLAFAAILDFLIYYYNLLYHYIWVLKVM